MTDKKLAPKADGGLDYDENGVFVKLDGSSLAASSSGLKTVAGGLFFSYVDFITGNVAFGEISGSFTVGIGFQVTQSCSITGVRFYWGGSTARTVKCSLWNPAGTRVASVNVVTSGAGYYTGTFSSPQAAAPAVSPGQGPSGNWKVSIWETGGSVYSGFVGAVAQLPALPWIMGPKMMMTQYGFFIAGDNNPTSSTSGEKYPVEPVFA